MHKHLKLQNTTTHNNIFPNSQNEWKMQIISVQTWSSFNLSKHASDPWITEEKRLYVMYVNPAAKQP